MVGQNPVGADLREGIALGVQDGVFLPIHGALLQSGVGLTHGQGSRRGAHPLPNLDIPLQVGTAELEAGEVLHGLHLLGGGHDPGATVTGTHQLEAGVIAHGVQDLLAQIAAPDRLEMVITVVDVRHDVDIGQICEGSQRTHGLAGDVRHAGGHALQHLGGGTQAVAAVEFNGDAAGCELLHLLLEKRGHIIAQLAGGTAVQRHAPGVFRAGAVSAGITAAAAAACQQGKHHRKCQYHCQRLFHIKHSFLSYGLSVLWKGSLAAGARVPAAGTAVFHITFLNGLTI